MDSLVVSGTTKTTRTTRAAGGTRTTETTGGTMVLTFRFLCVVGWVKGYYALTHSSSIVLRRLIITAGTPATIQWSGMSLVTTAFAPIITSLPIVTSPITFAPQQTVTLLPNIGVLLSLYPIVTCWYILQLQPILL